MYLLWKRKNRGRKDGGDPMQLRKYISVGSKLEMKTYSLLTLIEMTSLSNWHPANLVLKLKYQRGY